MVNVRQVEESILRTGREFRSATVNFRSEGNFKCLLFKYLRGLPDACIPSKIHKAEIELIHAEFPTAASSREHHDLVILTPNSAKIFERDYGKPVGVWSKKMQFTCVLEVKFSNMDPRYAPRVKKDIDRLSNVLAGDTARNACFILFIDRDVEWDNSTYRNLRRQFERATRKDSRLKVYCIPRKGDVIRIKGGTTTVM